MRDDVGLHDRHRHRPVGIEVDRRDVGLDHRRGSVGTADDGEMALAHLPVLDSLDAGAGNVHHDIAMGEIEAVALQPLQRRRELVEARLDRRVHGLERQAADRAEVGQAMTALEMLHRLDDGGVVDVARQRIGRQIAAGGEAPLQRNDVGSLRIRFQVADGSRDLRPAAPAGNLLMRHERLKRAVIGVGAVVRLLGARTERCGGEEAGSRRGEDAVTREHEATPEPQGAARERSLIHMVKESLRAARSPSPC